MDLYLGSLGIESGNPCMCTLGRAQSKLVMKDMYPSLVLKIMNQKSHPQEVSFKNVIFAKHSPLNVVFD